MSKIEWWEKLRSERILAVLIGVMGGVNLISAVTPALTDRFKFIETLFPLEVTNGTRLATALAGFALLQLAAGIWRGKRAAWVVTLVVLVLTFFSHLIKGFDVEEASLALAIIIGMILTRSRFQAKSDTPTIQRGLWTLGGAILFTFLYGTLGFFILDRQFSVRFNLPDAALQTIKMFAEFSAPGVIATHRFGRYFVDSIYAIGMGTMGYALISLLAPVLIRVSASESDREQAAEIVKKYGRTVLARFVLFDDKRYYFSSGGSVIAYVPKNRTAVVLGDPIGPTEDVSEAITSFAKMCAGNDWQPCYYQTLPDYLKIYNEHGMRSLKLGEEAVVDLSKFTLQGGEMKSVRTSVNKFERLGFSYTYHEPPHAEDLLDSLAAISNEWMIDRNASEMKFSMGWFDRAYLNTTPVLTLKNETGKLIAFVNLVDEFQNHELAVDMMRHLVEIPPGTMDFLFVCMLKKAQELGYERFNLGLSGLAGVGETSSDPAIERAMHFIYSRVKTAYNFRGLHNFKQKFLPDWSPRYLIYPNLASLPVVAVALNDVSS